jgi:hypothetical protein
MRECAFAWRLAILKRPTIFWMKSYGHGVSGFINTSGPALKYGRGSGVPRERNRPAIAWPVTPGNAAVPAAQKAGVTPALPGNYRSHSHRIFNPVQPGAWLACDFGSNEWSR